MWVTSSSSFPPLFPSLCQCLRQGSPGESSLTADLATRIPDGLEAGQAREKDLPLWEREGRRTHAVQQAAAGGLLRSALSSPGTVPPLCPQGAAPKAENHPAHPRDGSQEGRAGEGGDIRAVPHQRCSCLPEDAAGVTMATRDAPIPRPHWEPPPLTTC